MIRFVFPLLGLLFSVMPVFGGTGFDSLLYTPECLKDNMAFWEIIYQKMPSDRGLLHDQDTFRVIYDTLVVGDFSGRARSKGIKKREMEVSDILKRMAVTDTSAWDARMRRFGALWGRHLAPHEWLAASERVRFQLGQKDHFIAGLKRSGRYLAQIKEIFRSYELPEQLAYLPHVESSFNYRAYSKVGAAGIWQFMRSTGRLYLKVGYVVDERLDPIKATHAAAKLLRCNYRKLHSWPLAVTAYNHGAASMERAVNQTGTTDIGVIIDAYKTRSFQFASRNFYASFLAAYKTAVNYKSYFGDLALESPFTYTEYQLPKNARPSSLASVFKVSPRILQDYNLDVRPTIFKTNQYLPKGHILKLPAEFTAARSDSIVREIPEKVEVAEAETPKKPAPKEKPLPKVMVQETPKSAPSSAPVSPVVDTALPAAGIPKSLLAEKPAVSVKPDSLQTIWNYLYSAELSLTLQSPKKCGFCEFNPDYYELGFITETGRQVEVKVQIDETLGHLADWAGLTSAQLRNYNRRSPNVRLGERIRIPLTPETSADFLKARKEYHMGIEEDFFNNYEVTGLDTLDVKTGTNVWDLCQDNDVPLWLFLKVNPAIKDLHTIRHGKIVMPQIEGK